ncbi:hypothetical protein Psed_6792 (plasmid) [Pseudonocardia dioxanivorans CB1190]|uniref:Uncharacterized protein n=1 Tax=Pseudonocardia dioxanivorans (strain ATCC 55486 / DSM 44775 / JCM 13855 / CB1190) TaxID=675635 RepID=F2L6H4_PSEUX|nr:hypothetical protein [Pseudonocardia dioxanivorans]AEA28868.1 hypothetical protein Psed_6792 [Pseudonocardia dioxanivorans CB1190]
MLTSQPEALQHLARLVDDEDWRTDKRASWSAILRRLVCHMDWETGLITGLTARHLAAAGARAARTVSRVLAWAREIGLLVVVEPGASAEFLGTDTGRTPTYALVTHTPLPHLAGPQHDEQPGTLSAGQSPVEESGDLPTTPVSTKPLTGGRRTHLTSERRWHPYDVPGTPAARNAATLTLLSHLGLGGRRTGKIEIWRARALLKPWWDQGVTVTGLLHALEYHPDRPDHRRGDLTSGARDPLRILGARLRPWHGRLGEIRAVQIGRMRAGIAAKPTAKVDPALLDRPAGRGARRAAQEALSEHLRHLREARGTQHGHRPEAAVLPRRLRRPRIKR